MTRDDRTDDAIRDVHRRASAALDERPDGGVRATVLAAAASVAAARAPSSADAFRMRRMPLATAAAVVVSVAAGLLVAHVARDDPRRVVPDARVAMSGSDATIARVDTDEVPVVVRNPPEAREPAADDSPRTTGVARPRPAPQASTGPSSPAARDRAATDAAATRSRRSDPTPSDASPGIDPASPAPRSGSAAANAHAAIAASRDTARAAPASLDLATREAAPAADPPAPRAPAVAPLALRSAAAHDEPVDAWIARIVALRESARDADADRELAALRRRHPGVVVPPAALGANDAR